MRSKLSANARLDRRRFLKIGGATGALNLLSGVAKGERNSNSKLNLAFIGMGGQMQGHVSQCLNEGHHVQAFCDVDRGQIEASKKRHAKGGKGVATYEDYRELLAQEKDLDGVVIATPDHWHAPICKAAMKASKHVYCEKPLTHTVAEARELRELARSSKVVTQTGNQGSASEGLRRSIELLKGGLLGQISEVHVWHPKHGWPSGVDRPEGEMPIPEGLNWDFWLGPAPVRAFQKQIYHPGKWRGWYDFGNGSLGDFCCHSFNMPVRALDLDYPTKIEIRAEGLGKETFPTACTTRFDFPARGDRKAVQLFYHTGGFLPEGDQLEEVKKTFGGLPRTGCVLIGERGQLSSGLWNSQCYVKLNEDKKFLGGAKHPEAQKIEQSIPRAKGHIQEWLSACEGKGAVYSDFDKGGHLTEIGLAGVVALRLGKSIGWDGVAMEVPGEANAKGLVAKVNRQKWI